MRQRHPHVELLRALHVAEQRLLDGPLGSWPARDHPRSARRRAMRAVDHRTVRPMRPRALPLSPSCWAPDCGVFCQPSQQECAEWRRAGERQELPIAERTVSPPRVILPPKNCSPYKHTYTYTSISMYIYQCVYKCVCMSACIVSHLRARVRVRECVRAHTRSSCARPLDVYPYGHERVCVRV